MATETEHEGPITEMMDRVPISQEKLKAIRATLVAGESVCEMCGSIHRENECPACENG